MQIQKEKASREEEVRAGVISKSSIKQQNQEKKLKQKEKAKAGKRRRKKHRDRMRMASREK